MNQRQNSLMLLVLGTFIGFLLMFTVTGFREIGKSVPPLDSCWFTLYDPSGISSTVHVWNITETINDTLGDCAKLKDMCFTVQINHFNKHLDYNCRWLYADKIYGNNTCICSYSNIPGILNVTVV